MSGFISFEIYVKDVKGTVEFFVEKFNFEIEHQQPDFAVVWLGKSRLIINELKLNEFTPPNPVLKQGALDQLGSGLEIVISVSELENTREKLINSIAQKLGDIKKQDWGLKDFRFLLPDGYYIRVTEPDERVKQVW